MWTLFIYSYLAGWLCNLILLSWVDLSNSFPVNTNFSKSVINVASPKTDGTNYIIGVVVPLVSAFGVAILGGVVTCVVNYCLIPEIKGHDVKRVGGSTVCTVTYASKCKCRCTWYMFEEDGERRAITADHDKYVQRHGRSYTCLEVKAFSVTDAGHYECVVTRRMCCFGNEMATTKRNVFLNLLCCFNTADTLIILSEEGNEVGPSVQKLPVGEYSSFTPQPQPMKYSSLSGIMPGIQKSDTSSKSKAKTQRPADPDVISQLKRKQKVLRDIYPMPHWCLDVSGPLMMEARFEALKLQVHENPSLRRSVSRLPSDSGYWEVHLDQVFQPSTDDVGVVLITGETGTGKSTHCQHYAYKWAMSRIRNHFVVYIPLKRVSQCQSIGDMIEYLYDVRSDELLSYKGVIVLDGKDEVANFSPTILEEIDSASLLTQPVPDSELKVQKHKHKVIITSRPYTDKMRQLTNVIDARLSLYGIKENAYVTFTAEMFKKEKYEEYASYIRAQFEKCQFHNRFSDILNVPIYLTMFCFVFHSELSASKDIQGEKLSQLQSITKLVNRFMEMSMDKSGQRDGRHNIWIVNHPLTSQSCYSPRLRDSIKGLSKLCFEAVLTDNFMFSNQMFKKYDVDLKEIKQLGVLLSEEQLTIDSNTSSYIKEMSEVSVDDRIEYYMRHIMFVEYFAGVYVADYCDYNLKLPQEIDQLLQPYMRLSHCVKNIENVVLFAAGMSSKFMVELLHNACIDKRCCLMGREDHDTYLTEFHSVFLQECIVCHSQQVELVHSTFCEFVRESPISNMLLLSGLSPRESSLYPVIPLAQPIAHYDIKYFMERYFSIIAEFSTTIMESPRENDRPIVMFYGTKSTNIHHLSLGPFLGAMLLQLAATFNLVFPEITSMSTDFVQLPLASAIQLMSQLDAPQLTSLHLDGSSFNSTVTATRSDKVHKALKELTLNNYQCTIQQIMNFFSQVQMPHLQSLRITNTKLVFSPLSDSNLPNVKLRELVDITVEKFTSTMHNLLLMLKKINSSEVKKVTVSHFRTVSFKLDWHKDITHFSQLLDLNVDHVRCTLDELIHLLGVMRVPKLQSATLIHIHMLSNENEQNTRNIDMPSVAKFVIDHIQCSMPQLLNLLSRLHAPELLKLELCNIQLSSTSFQESGVKGFKKKTQNFVTFAKLTSLYIRFSSYASCEQVMMLFMKLNMPKLVELRLEFAVMRSKDSHAHSSDNYKSVKAITLPNLRTLQFDGNKQQLWCLRKKINTPALKEYSVLGTVYSDEYLVPISM